MSDARNSKFVWQDAFSQSGVSGNLGFIGLLMSLKDNGKGFFISQKMISDMTGLSERTVREHVSELKRLGWIKVVTRGGNQGGISRASTYQLVVPEPEPEDSRESVATANEPQPEDSRSQPEGSCSQPATSLPLVDPEPLDPLPLDPLPEKFEDLTLGDVVDDLTYQRFLPHQQLAFHPSLVPGSEDQWVYATRYAPAAAPQNLGTGEVKRDPFAGAMRAERQEAYPRPAKRSSEYA